jgi:ribonucleotide monophosphatase NagD (HAD superfamily)
LKAIYGIGDNPLADIQGANNAGTHWSSILVKTGIYDGAKDPEHAPDVHADSVFEAIQHIYATHGLPPL